MSHTINVPDVPAPNATLCWKQNALMHRCDRRADHLGPHTWEFSTWQPIESSPKDAHTRSLFWVVAKTADEAWCDSRGQPVVGDVVPNVRCGLYGTWSALCKATHWMPLPPPPAEPQENT